MSKKRSGFEDKVLRNYPGIDLFYETHQIPYQLAYVPDLSLPKKAGGIMHIELKGYLRPEDRTKMRRARKAHPNLDLRILFQRNEWLTTKHKMRYLDWAEKNKLKAHVSPSGQLPSDWLDEVDLYRG